VGKLKKPEKLKKPMRWLIVIVDSGKTGETEETRETSGK